RLYSGVDLMRVNLMKKSAPFAALVGLLVLTAGCTSPEGLFGAYDITATPENANPTKKITVTELTPMITVGFPAGQSTLSEMEKGRLLGFIDAQKIPFGEPVEVEFPSHAGAALAEQRFAEVAA